jgi:hypothetical protein
MIADYSIATAPGRKCCGVDGILAAKAMDYRKLFNHDKAMKAVVKVLNLWTEQAAYGLAAGSFSRPR